MSSKDFVIWLKGFTEGCHEYAPTPKQWDRLKEKLSQVDDRPERSFPSISVVPCETGTGGTGVLNTTVNSTSTALRHPLNSNISFSTDGGTPLQYKVNSSKDA